MAWLQAQWFFDKRGKNRKIQHNWKPLSNLADKKNKAKVAITAIMSIIALNCLANWFCLCKNNIKEKRKEKTP